MRKMYSDCPSKCGWTFGIKSLKKIIHKKCNIYFSGLVLPLCLILNNRTEVMNISQGMAHPCFHPDQKDIIDIMSTRMIFGQVGV